eukprot:NODE_166_length_14584_cov_1.124750.p3 type:complete len:446 gc:universal NODE_166_length_14584_cov_1.124750:694-2031(+)
MILAIPCLKTSNKPPLYQINLLLMSLLTGPSVVREYNQQLNHSKNIQVIPLAGLGHQNYVYGMALTTNPFRILLTSDSTGGIFIWDAFASINGDQLLSRIHRQGLVDTITRQGVLLGSFEAIDNPRLPVKTNTCAHSLAIHSQGVWCLVGTQNGFLNMHSVRYKPGTVVHDFGSTQLKFKRPPGPITDICINQSQDKCMTGDWNGDVTYWDLVTGKEIARFRSAENSQVTSMKFANVERGKTSESVAFSTNLDGSVNYMDLRSNKQKIIHPVGKTPPWAMEATDSDDGRKLLVGRRDNKVDEYDKLVFHKEYQLPAGSGPVSHAKYLPNGHAICSSIDNIRVLNLVDYDALSAKKKNENATENDFLTPSLIQSSHHGGPISRLELDVNYEFMFSGLGVRDLPLDAFTAGVSTTFQLNSKSKKQNESNTGHINCLLYQVKPAMNSK